MVLWLSFTALVLAAPASGEDCRAAFARSTASPEYIALVDSYRNRQWLDAVQAAARFDHEALESFVEQLDPAHIDQRSDPCVEAAALLHTNTAMYLMAEAKLRYGKVLEKRGRFDDALQHLEVVIALEADHYIIYRARMALGNLAERHGHPEPAIRHYRAAIELEPDWQIGYLALSHALHTASEREASRTALEEALSLSESAASGWWEYEVGLSERADPLFSSMREALAR